MKTEYIHIRISPELKEKLKIEAEKDGRTMSNYIEKLLKEKFEKE